MTVLHLDSSPRQEESLSRHLSGYLVEQLNRKGTVYRDLADGFPPLAARDLVAIHGSRQDGTENLARHQDISETLMGELFAADTLVIGVAMQNFTVPAVLKHWIDYVARAGRTFRYTENGPEGLTDIEHGYLVVASGGTPIGGDWDFASGYLAHICRFIGVRNVHVIDASGSKREPEKIIARAKGRIDELVEQQQAA